MHRADAKNTSWIRAAIATGNTFHYKKKNVLRHNALNLFIFSTLVGAIVAILLAGALAHPLIYIPVAAAALGLLYFAALVLVAHEAAHGMFIISRNSGRARFWNRFFGWIVSLFFGMHFIDDWEKGHIHHHLHPMEETDSPFYRALPLGRDLIRESVKMLLIPAYLLIRERQLQHEHASAEEAPSRPTAVYRFAGMAVLWVSVLTVTWGGWAAPVAAGLGLQVMCAIEQIKLALEHGGEVGRDHNRFLRARTSLFPMRQILLPLNISLHFEHHLNYCVPWYDLPRYHRALLDVVPRQMQPFVFNRDLRGQLWGRKGRTPSVESRTLAANDSLMPSRDSDRCRTAGTG
jgi:fatty acid desaturase